MSQLHLYGQSYVSLNPPSEWRDVTVESTVNDSLVESGITEQVLTFEGDAGEFVLDWMNTNGKGSFNGIPYKIVYESNINLGDTNTRFDGFIDVYHAEIFSESSPVIVKAPVKPIEDPKTVIENMSVMTQGLLVQKGYLNPSHYIDFPVIRESKKNVAERALILKQYGVQIVQSFTQMVNNMLSAVSDILGASVVIGIVELLMTFVNAVIMINQLVDQGMRIKDLLFPKIYYYKAASWKTILTQAYAYKGYSVNFGIADEWMSKAYVFASQNEFDGYPFQGFPATGELKSNDWGYIIGRAQETLSEMLDLRFRVKDGVVHIRPRKDPYWYESPTYQWEDILIKTAGPHVNGTIKYDTERVKSTVVFNYSYDMSDAHTLTEKNGDSHEVHRELIVELNEKMNTLKGLHEVNIPWAMAVRKKPLDNLWDLFTGVSDDFDTYLQSFKDKINDFMSDISGSGVDVMGQVSTILSQTGLNLILQNRDGCLKIDDNAFAVPKLLWLEKSYTDGIGDNYRIPSNFKDFIGAKALYNDWHRWMSPADVSGFRGQYRLYSGVNLRWAYEKFLQTQDNPNFDMNGFDANFTFISWLEAQHSAAADIQQQKPFDTNITEVEI